MRRTHLHDGIETNLRNAMERLPDTEVVVKTLQSEISKSFPTSHSQRPFVTMLVDSVFGRAVELVAVGQYPAAHLEIHALLEEAAIRYLPRRISTKSGHKVVASLVKRKTLSDIAPLYEDLNFWSAADLAFVRGLSSIRNGISHRNFSLLEKHLSRTSDFHALEGFEFSLEKTASGSCGK